MYNKFEKGVTYYNLFKGDMSIWAENVQKFTISTAQLTSAFTTPILLVSSIPGYALFPTFLVINKPDGGNCGVAGVTAMGVFWRGGSVFAIGFGALGTNFFTISGNVQTYLPGPGSASTGALYGGFTTANPAGDQYGNRDLVFSTSGANLTVSAGAPTLTMLLGWRQIPLVLPLA